ncbi:CHAT domain-containing protein [Microbacterium terricola]|uniref:CHAT domain-containing protein n=1 Tax=Microbacterium terricola TaxID=344163 RepID=A0ABM8DYP0_9MICO|nr:CHAT domain-containing protein [Microbacterium terricola]UYK41504.1 CHAT domain-containing protein [Microbacterium terricola]BDV30705.1 hypothetical protein Microterr_13650 [Microbacterium terricola]
MGSFEERAFEVVLLAAAFRNPRGRAYVAEFFPASVVDLYDAVVADGAWQAARNLTEQGLVIARALDEYPDIAAAYQASVDAGELGFGAGEDEEMDAAIRDVTAALDPGASGAEPVESAADDPGSDGLLGATEPVTEPLAEAPPELAPPPVAAAPAAPPPVAAAPAAPPAAPPAAGDEVQTWLNAEVDNDGNPLQVATPYTFAVFFGEKSATAQAAAVATLRIPDAADSIDLSVTLVSSDFDTPAHPQTLTVGRDGRSKGRALFEITPNHDGPSTVSVLVDVAGNFLQRLDVTFDVGTDAAPAVTSYGRPVGAAQVLEQRTATMQFLPAVGGYQLIATAVSPDPIEIRITPDELAARIEGVREVLLDTVKNRDVALNMTISPADAWTFLQGLAFAGFRLFQSIFAGPEASRALKDVGIWLRETLSGATTTLQVVSTGFPVPWALMYLTDRFDAAPPSWDNFIGMRHVVEQIPMAEISAVPPAITIDSTPDMRVRALFNDSIDESMPSKPVAEQRRYWGGRGVALTEGASVDDLVKSALAAGSTDKVLYLYCHAEASSKDSDDSRLIFTGSTSVSLGQLAVFAPIEDVLESHPLVFINACESGELTPNFYDGFVPYFLAKGARGVIGTECKTPGLFASEWAKAFFDELFAGRPLGEVVLELRKHFLAEHNNPLGLLYGVHCDTDTVVAPALVRSP